MYIYKIENKVNGKIYIGKTQKSIEERFNKHKYNHINGQTHLYRAMRKHSIDQFDITLIEECLDDLNEREKHWINILRPEYNMTPGGEGGDTSNSLNWQIAMKEHHENRTYYPGARMLGKTHSEETKLKQSQKRTKHWAALSDEERSTRSKKTVGLNNGMYGKTPKNSLQVVFNGIEYSSISEASRATGHSAKYVKKHGEIINNELE